MFKIEEYIARRKKDRLNEFDWSKPDFLNTLKGRYKKLLLSNTS